MILFCYYWSLSVDNVKLQMHFNGNQPGKKCQFIVSCIKVTHLMEPFGFKEIFIRMFLFCYVLFNM